MKFRIALLAAVSMLTVLISKPAHLHSQQAADVQQHEPHHPDTVQRSAQAAAGQRDLAKMMATMKANDQRLDELVNKMNAARGTAKVDAIADLLSALVQDRRMMRDSMASHMSTMMNMMGTMNGQSGMPSPK
jgi:hypothetical protein